MEEVLKRMKEFSQYLDEINLEELTAKNKRQEIEHLREEFRKIRLRSVSYELGMIAKEMKLKEYPELLGVHNFPVLKEIDFLTEEKKIELDKLLVKLRKGSILFGSVLGRVIPERSDLEKTLKWMVENEILEKEYRVLCPRCMEHYIGKSARFTVEEREKLDESWKNYLEGGRVYEDYEKVLKYVEDFCEECDMELDTDVGKKFQYEEQWKMAIERDKSLDNV